MLVPHFSQTWVFLTPPTDGLTFGLLGERFPGKRRAASGVRKQPLDWTFWHNSQSHFDADVLPFIKSGRRGEQSRAEGSCILFWLLNSCSCYMSDCIWPFAPFSSLRLHLLFMLLWCNLPNSYRTCTAIESEDSYRTTGTNTSSWQFFFLTVQ